MSLMVSYFIPPLCSNENIYSSRLVRLSFRFIYEELQLSPWNTTGDFIEVHKKAAGGALMKLTGIGDPSGVGEAYNFLREADSRASKSTSTTDGALSAQIKKITGTEVRLVFFIVFYFFVDLLVFVFVSLTRCDTPLSERSS